MSQPWFLRSQNGVYHPTNNGWKPYQPPRPRQKRYAIHIGLFLVTLATTIVAGMVQENVDPLQHPELFYRGVPYAVTLLAILFCHEMGHYCTARYYGMDVSLPYFIPAPPPFLAGTLGAFIRMKSPPEHRCALLYVGAAGPIAGFCVAVPAMIYAYATSSVESLAALAPRLDVQLIACSKPLLDQLVAHFVVGTLPHGNYLALNSIGFAAWFGLLVTAFNLLPMGQLDGGHILYALWGQRARTISWLMIGILLALGYLWPGWFVWAFLGWLTSRRQPLILDQESPLNRHSRVIAGVALAIFVLCFMPVPFSILDFNGP
jgi:membrane-associated protease RseP (regulator of RpoE activity)